MRITGGVWASRPVFGPPARWPLRPTPDALREQAFSILAPWLSGAVFLDLFAGTGVVSLEALSRGAARAIVVERHPQALSLVRRNFHALEVEPERYQLIAKAAHDAVRCLHSQGVTVQILWADPPFVSFSECLPTIRLAGDCGVLQRDGFVVLEHPPKARWDLPGFVPVRTLRGAALLRFQGKD